MSEYGKVKWKLGNCRIRDRGVQVGQIRPIICGFLGIACRPRGRSNALQKFERRSRKRIEKSKVEFLLMDDVRSFQLSAGNYKSKMETSIKEEDRSSHDIRGRSKRELVVIDSNKINIYSSLPLNSNLLLSLISISFLPLSSNKQKKINKNKQEKLFRILQNGRRSLDDARTLLTRFKSYLRIFPARIVQIDRI